MNIGFFTDTYQSGYSGVEHSIDIFKRELENRGHTVYIFAPLADEKMNTPEENRRGIYRLQAMSQMFFPEFKMTFPVSYKVFAHLRKFNLDIIHSHTPFLMGFYANVVGFAFNIPAIHTYHTFYEKYSGHSFISDREKADKFLMNIVTRISVLHSDRCEHVIVPSKKMKDVLQRYDLGADVSVLPTGLDLSEFEGVDRQVFRKELAVSEETKILTYVGRIAKEKNIKFLIDALEEVSKENSVKLVILGKGPEEKIIREYISSKGLEDAVVFLGHRKRQKVLEALAGSDLFWFASLTDTQSLALGEAIASRLPVVMLRDNGLLEIMKDGINGFEAVDLADFVEKTNKLLSSDKLRSQFSDAAGDIVKEYDIAIKTDQLVSLYEKIVKEYYQESIRTRMKKTLIGESELKDYFSTSKNKEFFEKISERTKNLFK